MTMIESGSHVPGISAADFGLPVGTALRYEQPASPLRELFPSYAVLDSDLELLMPGRPAEYMLPGWAQIWIVLTAGPISVRIGNRSYDPLKSAILYGVTSRSMPTTATGGTTVVIDISPRGWARMFGPVAEALRDRITPLAEVMPADWVEELVTRLHASDRTFDVKRILDEFLLRRFPEPGRDEHLIAQIMPLLNDEAVSDLGIAVAAAGINSRRLRRLSKQYFGFPPKLLMTRSRLLRTIIPELLNEDRNAHHAPPHHYHDASHFNRDGIRFLGMTPRRFAALPLPYLRAALRARSLVIGAAMPSLDS